MAENSLCTKKIGRFDGYRTTAFFGFDLPRDPKQNRLFSVPFAPFCTPSKFRPIRRSKSLEDVFCNSAGTKELECSTLIQKIKRRLNFECENQKPKQNPVAGSGSKNDKAVVQFGNASTQHDSSILDRNIEVSNRNKHSAGSQTAGKLFSNKEVQTSQSGVDVIIQQSLPVADTNDLINLILNRMIDLPSAFHNASTESTQLDSLERLELIEMIDNKLAKLRTKRQESSFAKLLRDIDDEMGSPQSQLASSPRFDWNFSGTTAGSLAKWESIAYLPFDTNSENSLTFKSAEDENDEILNHVDEKEEFNELETAEVTDVHDETVVDVNSTTESTQESFDIVLCTVTEMLQEQPIAATQDVLTLAATVESPRTFFHEEHQHQMAGNTTHRCGCQVDPSDTVGSDTITTIVSELNQDFDLNKNIACSLPSSIPITAANLELADLELVFLTIPSTIAEEEEPEESTISSYDSLQYHSADDFNAVKDVENQYFYNISPIDTSNSEDFRNTTLMEDSTLQFPFELETAVIEPYEEKSVNVKLHETSQSEVYESTDQVEEEVAKIQEQLESNSKLGNVENFSEISANSTEDSTVQELFDTIIEIGDQDFDKTIEEFEMLQPTEMAEIVIETVKDQLATIEEDQLENEDPDVEVSQEDCSLKDLEAQIEAQKNLIEQIKKQFNLESLDVEQFMSEKSDEDSEGNSHPEFKSEADSQKENPIPVFEEQAVEVFPKSDSFEDLEAQIQAEMDSIDQLHKEISLENLDEQLESSKLDEASEDKSRFMSKSETDSQKENLIPVVEENQAAVGALDATSSTISEPDQQTKDRSLRKFKRNYIAENIQKVASPVRSKVNNSAIFSSVNPFANVASAEEIKRRKKQQEPISNERPSVPNQRKKNKKKSSPEKNTENRPAKNAKRSKRSKASLNDDEHFKTVQQKLTEHCENQSEMYNTLDSNLKQLGSGIKLIDNMQDELKQDQINRQQEVTDRLRQELSRIEGFSTGLSEHED